MADAATVRRLAASLPEVKDRSKPESLAFYLGGKLFAWSWPEPAGPRRARVPRLDVLVLRCAMEAKETILEADPDKFFATAHYDGYPVVLLRLETVDEEELRSILLSAWRSAAPPALQGQAGVS
jgi:hypothetical protein